MALNSVRIFGSVSGGNGAASLTFLILFVIMLLGAIVALGLILYDNLRNRRDEVIVAEDEEPLEALEEAVPAEDVEMYRAGRLSYNKSFLAKYIQSDDTVKEWYNQIKNELMSYERVHSRLSWRRESFRYGRDVVARLAIRGKTLCIYLPIDPKKYADSDYRVEDASDVAAFADTPCVYRVRSDQRLEYAFELIEDAMHTVGAEKGDQLHDNYYLPYQNLSQLIEKGLVKRVERG